MVIEEKIIDVLVSSVLVEGGDGDAIWLTQSTSLDVIESLIRVYEAENHIGWNITRDNNKIIYGENEENVVITNNEDEFNNSPSWITLKIKTSY